MFLKNVTLNLLLELVIAVNLVIVIVSFCPVILVIICFSYFNHFSYSFSYS